MTLNQTPQRHALSLAVAAALSSLAAVPAHAQTVPPAPLPAATTTAPQPTPSTPPSRPAAVLPEVVVTGNPLRANAVSTPVTTLSGDGLSLRRGSTLGDTLDGLPGVSSSYFGPNANRPVIRGQDGDRIRVLSNSGGSLDASSLSFDHAVPIDPMVIERIEVLRGPAALLYGGSAVGGVVNAVDNRIPRTPVGGPTGTAELRLGGAARERGTGASIEAGGAGFALHADAFRRKTDDLEVPEFDRPVPGGTERRQRIVNSASQAEGGAVGGSMVWDHGFLGASLDTYRNTYGIVAEEDVNLRMQRDKLALSGEVRSLRGPIETVRGQLHRTDYEHEELEGTGEVGTTFRTQGTDGRLELVHAPITLGGNATLRGVLGVQAEQSQFSALGEEAFVPSTRTRQAAGFVFEELPLSQGKLTFGARAERTRVRSEGDLDPAAAQFGPADARRFTAGNAAVGGLLNLAPQWALSGNLAYSQRAPTFYELYANGVHVATAAYERGDRGLEKEKGRHVDAAVEWKESGKEGANRLKAGVFVASFSNYIALLRTGEPDFVNDEGEAFAVQAFTGVPARLRGLEFEGAWRPFGTAQPLDLDGKLDLTRGTQRLTGEALPRIAPLRTTLGATWRWAGCRTRAEVVHAARQSRVPSDDVPTPSHTLVNLSTSHRLALGPTDALVFVKLTNLGDKLAYNAASAASVRALAPLPGRALMVGVRVGF
ncbi:MAG: TonB-dependent receptor [Pseudomonadota bacterium]